MPPLANYTKLSTTAYDGNKSLFGGQVTKGMPTNDMLCIISGLIETLFGQIGYDCIDLEKLGIKCLDDGEDKKCVILNWMVDHILSNEQSVSNIYLILNTINTSIGLLKDEKVKVRAAGVAAYLEDIIKAPASNIVVTDNDITFMGFVPLGFCGTVNPNRLTDFDATGKGKINTDMWGWAIRNGNNGTQNVLGLFPKYTETTAVAGSVAGEEEFVIDKLNIKSMTVPVSGLIMDSLENNVTFKFDATNNFNGGPRPNGFASNHTGSVSEYQTKPYNFKHGHGFSLNAILTNPNPTPIPLVPKHIKEIPIERINP